MEKKTEPLNNLDGKEWVKYTKSVWIEDSCREYIRMQDISEVMESGIMFSLAPPRDELKKKHPATFSERDVAKLIRFFTKKGELVLDPFLGTGSSAIASLLEGRDFIGIELYQEWLDLARERIMNIENSSGGKFELYCGDALKIMKNLKPSSIDFIITSPPYWGHFEKRRPQSKKRKN